MLPTIANLKWLNWQRMRYLKRFSKLAESTETQNSVLAESLAMRTVELVVRPGKLIVELAVLIEKPVVKLVELPEMRSATLAGKFGRHFVVRARALRLANVVREPVL